LILIHHIGAKSGRERVTPVSCFPQSDGRFAIVASNGGAPMNPNWYYNLKAHPEITVEFGAETFPVAVRELAGAERDRLWADVVGAEPGVAETQRRAARPIPLLLLTRISWRRKRRTDARHNAPDGFPAGRRDP
jgi:deazaflavin-dependent oxidoreductase (nitroreductase family)